MKLLLCILMLTHLCYALHPETQFKKAYDYLTQGNYEQALELYQQLEHVMPNTAEILCPMGFCLQRMNKQPQAIEIYEKARALSGKPQPAIERALSHAYLSTGDFERGWKAYEYRWVNPPPYHETIKEYIAKG